MKYYDEWKCYADITEYVGKLPLEIDIIYAGYTYEDYSGAALIVFMKGGKVYENNDGHCSCYGLEDWNPEETSVEALRMRTHWPGLQEALNERFIKMEKVKLEKFSDLVGNTLKEIFVNSKKDEVIFTLQNDERYMLYHSQNCCEGVELHDVQGDWLDLLEEPILFAEESSNSEDPPVGEYDSSYTWTFYRIGTVKGTVVMRWFGSSNGYYSESVDWKKIGPDGCEIYE